MLTYTFFPNNWYFSYSAQAIDSDLGNQQCHNILCGPIQLSENPRCPYKAAQSLRRCQHYISLSQLCWRLCFHSNSSQNFSLIFSVPPGLECMKEQDLCNKIMATILENYNTLFEVEHTGSDNQSYENPTKLIIVKVSLIFSFSGLLYVEWKTFYLHHCFS